MNATLRQFAFACGAVLGVGALLCAGPGALAAESTPLANKASSKEKTVSGSFVSFKEGTLTISGPSGSFVCKEVGANYKTFQNNEEGPGSKLVDTVDALNHVKPGTMFQVNVEAREISFGLDHRVIGTLESYENGRLNLRAAEAPVGFIKRPAGNVVLSIDPEVPVLESVEGGDYKYAGPAGEVLKGVKPGTMLTARGEYDINAVEVIQIGEPRRKIERYVGQSRGTVRGPFVSFKDGILRIRGKGVNKSLASEYERVIGLRISNSIPIVESIDGGAYQRAGAEALKTVKEGTVVTVRKVEEVILEIQIGVAAEK